MPVNISWYNITLHLPSLGALDRHTKRHCLFQSPPYFWVFTCLLNTKGFLPMDQYFMFLVINFLYWNLQFHQKRPLYKLLQPTFWCPVRLYQTQTTQMATSHV